MKATIKPFGKKPLIKIKFHDSDAWSMRSILAPIIKACIEEHAANDFPAPEQRVRDQKVIDAMELVIRDDYQGDFDDKYVLSKDVAASYFLDQKQSEQVQEALKIFAEDFMGYWT